MKYADNGGQCISYCSYIMCFSFVTRPFSIHIIFIVPERAHDRRHKRLLKFHFYLHVSPCQIYYTPIQQTFYFAKVRV